MWLCWSGQGDVCREPSRPQRKPARGPPLSLGMLRTRRKEQTLQYMVPRGAAIPSCAQGYIKAGKNWPLGWMTRNSGDGAGEEGCLSVAGLWPPGLPSIPGFYELPGFITNSLHTGKALPGSLCCFKLQSKRKGYELMERCQENPRRANPRQNLPVRKLMGCF